MSIAWPASTAWPKNSGRPRETRRARAAAGAPARRPAPGCLPGRSGACGVDRPPPRRPLARRVRRQQQARAQLHQPGGHTTQSAFWPSGTAAGAWCSAAVNWSSSAVSEMSERSIFCARARVSRWSSGPLKPVRVRCGDPPSLPACPASSAGSAWPPSAASRSASGLAAKPAMRARLSPRAVARAKTAAPANAFQNSQPPHAASRHR